MAPRDPAWSHDAEGRPTWTLDSYFIEGARSTEWFAPGVVKYPRTLGTTLNALIAAGFVIRRVEEFVPSAEQIAAQPELVTELERPTFLLVCAQRD